MFYHTEILNKKGKFGTIWLAATCSKRLTRREILGVQIANSSEDILQNLLSTSSSRERHSLYLSSQLMCGLASLHRMQVNFLLEETKELLGRIQRTHHPISSTSIDLEDSARNFRVTFDEPDYDAAPVDFGSFSIRDATSIGVPSYNYFTVSTPKSPNEWHISPGYPDRPPRILDVGTDFIARPEDITLPDIEEERRAGRETDHFLTDIIDAFEEPIPFVSTIQARPEAAESIPLETGPEMQGLQLAIDTGIIEPSDIEMQPRIESVPEPEIAELAVPEVEVTQPEQQPSIPDAIPSTSFEPPEHRRGSSQIDEREPSQKRKRSRTISSEFSFVLPPPPPTGRRGRRRQRHLIIDAETQISSEEIRRNINTANERLIRPRVHFYEFVNRARQESLFSNFGLRALARGNKIFQKRFNPRTLPEPDDPSRFGHFLSEEPEIAEEVPAITLEAAAPDLTMGQEAIAEAREEATVEEPRAEDTSSSLFPASRTGLSSRQSRLLQDTRDPISSARTSLQVPDILSREQSGITGEFDTMRDIIDEQFLLDLQQEPAVMPPIIPREEEIQQPINEIEHDVAGLSIDEIQPSTSARRICVLPREEKTPPPPSPEAPKSPLVEHAMQYIKEVFNEDPTSEVITFTSVLEKTSKKKAVVSKMFYLILTLHASEIIKLHQEIPDREIFIYKGPKFNSM